MELPKDIEVYQDELAFYWMENDMLLCSVTKSTPRTVENIISTFELIEEITEGKKVCLLSDTTATGSRPDYARAISIKMVVNYFKALAMFSISPFGKLVVNSFITVSCEPIPMKLFSNELEAREWLNEYLE